MLIPQLSEIARGDPTPAVELATVRSIYLIGIGGTGMGSFAGLLQSAGYRVAGSDEALYPPMSEMLQRWAIPALSGYRAEQLDAPFHGPPDLVIVGNVVRRANPEAAAVRSRGLPYLSFPQALGEMFLARRESLVVAGTHGKTTTSALLTHLLVSAGRDPSALIGGVAGNLLADGGSGNFRVGQGAHFVVEGDEYDSAYFDKGPKFLHYRPQRAVLTSVEFDHADIYRDLAHYTDAFHRFVDLLPRAGHLAVAAAHPGAVAVAQRAACRVESYGIDQGELSAVGLVFDSAGAHFALRAAGRPLGHFDFPIFGRQNVENALGASSVALAVGLDPEELRRGLATFSGVRRRQEILGRPGGVTLIDDFAHHPTAVRATLEAVRARFPQAPLFACFEPRSNTSRRRVYQAEYAEAFAGADRVAICAPQGGSPIPDGEALDPAELAAAINRHGVAADYFPAIPPLVEWLAGEAHAGAVILLMSNGAFGGLAKRLLARLAGDAPTL